MGKGAEDHTKLAEDLYQADQDAKLDLDGFHPFCCKATLVPLTTRKGQLSLYPLHAHG